MDNEKLRKKISQLAEQEADALQKIRSQRYAETIGHRQ